MDRLDFSKSIDIDPVTQIEKLFNEIMAMYDLVGGYNYLSIHGFINGNNTVSFSVLFSSDDEAKQVYDTVVNKQIAIYGFVYSLHGTMQDQTINLNITRIY